PNNNSQVISDPSHIPSILYEHFASVSTKLANDVLRQWDVLLLPNNKSYGLYSFPAQCPKCSWDILSPVQSKIFETSI
ncbi:unnamed protein product, partial [Pocillopora meandrina]